MKKYGKVDANQNEIVRQLRQLRISVAITSSLGNGFPDLVVGYNDKNYLIELKDSQKPKSQKKLTRMEQEFFDNWRGQTDVCENISSVLEVIKWA